MLEHFIQSIGLSITKEKIRSYHLLSVVEDIFLREKQSFTDEELRQLYIYDIPKLSKDGTCSILSEKNEKPYILSQTF